MYRTSVKKYRNNIEFKRRPITSIQTNLIDVSYLLINSFIRDYNFQERQIGNNNNN